MNLLARVFKVFSILVGMAAVGTAALNFYGYAGSMAIFLGGLVLLFLSLREE